jgi:hypothetical protein
MTSFRARVLAFFMLVFTALPALAQEETTAAATINPAASLSCLGAGLVALVSVGVLSNMRERQGEQDPTVKPNPDDRTDVSDIADVGAAARPSA